MTKVYQLEGLPLGPVTKGNWTAVIPAAGRGTRLGFDKPKILYPILGRPILDWLLDSVLQVCGDVVLVLSPEGRGAVEPVFHERLGKRGCIVVQDQPTGMADAIRLTEGAIQTQYALVVWGDQVTLTATTMKACAALHETRSDATLTLATIMKRDPYIDVQRGADDRIIAVHQAREGEVKRSIGENDCGLFLFTNTALFSTLAAHRDDGRGHRTGEANLLPLLPAFEQAPGSVATVRLSDLDETQGVNTIEEAALSEKILTRRQSAGP